MVAQSIAGPAIRVRSLEKPYGTLDPQLPRDHRGLLAAGEPLTRLVPDPFPKLSSLGGQPAALCVPRTSGLRQGSAPDNNPKRSVGPFCRTGHSHEVDEQQVASYRAVCFRVRPRRGSRRSQWRCSPAGSKASVSDVVNPWTVPG
jgi:hypothetical protein